MLAIIVGIGSTIFMELAATLTRLIDIASTVNLLLAAARRRRCGRDPLAGAAAVTYASGALALGGLRAAASGSAAALHSAAVTSIFSESATLVRCALAA